MTKCLPFWLLFVMCNLSNIKAQTMNSKTNEALITKFYTAFAQLKAEDMVACYDSTVVFEDPGFGVLINDDAKNMWRMLTSNNKSQLKITFDCVTATDTKGSANWVASYIFSATGRPVINRVSAQFEFKNGKISKHTDSFNFWTWSRQALGFVGYTLGWSSFLQNKVKQKTNSFLRSYSQTK
jgi:ketosteroid isomerase-like protein